jgi:DNA mismatch endonuclease, patch repair protein
VSMSPPPYPTPTSTAVTAVMRANRKVGSKPETQLRSALHQLGYRFRKNLEIQAGDVRVRPDIVFTRQRLAVFVDGCFWHRCPTHGTRPRVNTSYWGPKLERNVSRDRRVTAALENEGWFVLRIWEHEPLDEAVRLVNAALARAEPWGGVKDGSD